MCEAASESSGDSGREEEETAQGSGQVTVRVCIRTQQHPHYPRCVSELVDTLAEASAALPSINVDSLMSPTVPWTGALGSRGLPCVEVILQSGTV